ncbi:vitamin K epoxide reductase family protein [Candidatus Saccharibacteria bacterium]|nr:vitamin K epoxide reductase family protein [Candidatus Saccharibacteria bacterium]
MDSMKKFTKPTFKQVFPWVLTIGGILGLLAAGILTAEKLHLAANPDYVPSCSISPVVACSPVITSPQASAFGFPNPFLGLAGFAMVWTVGMMLFAGGTIKKKWFWWCFQAGSLFGMFFIGWLINEALYDIGKLCIYCMLVWAVTIPIFWTTLTFNLREKNIVIKGKVGELLAQNPGKLIALSYLLVVGLIITRFSDYFYSLIG